MRVCGLQVPPGLSRSEWDRVAGQWVDFRVPVGTGSVVVDGSELVDCAGWGWVDWRDWVACLPAGAAVSLQVGNGLVLGLSVPSESWQEVASCV